MPHPKKYWIPFEDWNDYLDLPEMMPEEIALKELLVLAEKLKNQLDRVESIIEERIKQMDGKRKR